MRRFALAVTAALLLIGTAQAADNWIFQCSAPAVCGKDLFGMTYDVTLRKGSSDIRGICYSQIGNSGNYQAVRFFRERVLPTPAGEPALITFSPGKGDISCSRVLADHSMR